VAKHSDELIPLDINDIPDPSVFVAPPETYRRPRKKGRRATLEAGLTITSLMDALTIILVFLLKSYSNSPVQLKQADDLKLPMSSTEVIPTDSTAVVITLNDIVVDDKPAVRLDNGKVASSDLSSGDLLIEPLMDKLADSVGVQKRLAAVNNKIEFKGIMTIVADRQVNFNLLTQVMYTAGQAEFSRFKFAAIKKSQ